MSEIPDYPSMSAAERADRRNELTTRLKGIENRRDTIYRLLAQQEGDENTLEEEMEQYEGEQKKIESQLRILQLWDDMIGDI